MNAIPASKDMIPGVSPDIYSADDFAKIAKIIYGAAGIVLPQGKAMLVYSRLAPLVRTTGSVTFGKYIELIGEDPAELCATGSRCASGLQGARAARKPGR